MCDSGFMAAIWHSWCMSFGRLNANIYNEAFEGLMAELSIHGACTIMGSHVYTLGSVQIEEKYFNIIKVYMRNTANSILNRDGSNPAEVTMRHRCTFYLLICNVVSSKYQLEE